MITLPKILGIVPTLKKLSSLNDLSFVQLNVKKNKILFSCEKPDSKSAYIISKEISSKFGVKTKSSFSSTYIIINYVVSN